MPRTNVTPHPAAGDVRIGISGWNYRSWRGVFYPEGLAHRRELAFASGNFDTIEINGSFYSLLRPASVKRWYDETPDDFVFALKGSRFITHMKRLAGVDVAVANFFASGVLVLEEKLGPILWQLPPATAFDAEKLARFFDLLPRTTRAAAALARRHDRRLEGRAHTRTARDRPIRYAIEVRHPSFADPAFIALLREHRVALAVADTAGRFPDFEDVTTDFVYVRLHGDTQLYASGYGKAALARWAKRVEAWRDGAEVGDARLASPKARGRRGRRRDVYVYFDNDAKVRAPFDARALRALVDRRPARFPPRSMTSFRSRARSM